MLRTLGAKISAAAVALGTCGFLIAGPVVAHSASATVESRFPACNGSFDFRGHANDSLTYTAPAFRGSHQCTLRPGDRGNAVYVLQQSLGVCYSFNVDATSRYDEATEHAVRSLQQRFGQDDDGHYGPQLAESMLHWGERGPDGDSECSTIIVNR